MSLSVLQAQLHSVMERLSNSDPVDVSEAIIEQALEEFEAALRKQLGRSAKEPFRLRMSNIGRAACQLQMEKSGAERTRFPANHILRMMIGDAVEVYLTAMLRMAGANITGGKDQVSLSISGTTIKGESDIDFDGAVWDIKSASPWAVKNKWSKGYRALAEEDSFGYIGQLYGYATGQGEEMGGWVVADKSSGEVVFVEATPTAQELKEIRQGIEKTINTVESDAPFERCFEPEIEYFRRKPTGSKRLGTQCSFCDYKHSCYPDLQYKPQTKSEAANPRYYWYTEYADESN
jgi:hypothetical protein